MAYANQVIVVPGYGLAVAQAQHAVKDMAAWRRLGELWRSRELFSFLVRKEIKVKYKNSVLGFLWSMLNPALTLAVFYVLFTFFLPNGIPNFVISETLFQPIICHSSARIGSIQALYGPSPTVLS